MTMKKAIRRYPYGTIIKYLGDKNFIVHGGNYNFYGIDRCIENIAKNAIGRIVGFVMEKGTGNCIGIKVDFRTSMDFVDDFPKKLLFGEDLFVRSF